MGKNKLSDLGLLDTIFELTLIPRDFTKRLSVQRFMEVR